MCKRRHTFPIVTEIIVAHFEKWADAGPNRPKNDNLQADFFRYIYPWLSAGEEFSSVVRQFPFGLVLNVSCGGFDLLSNVSWFTTGRCWWNLNVLDQAPEHRTLLTRNLTFFNCAQEFSQRNWTTLHLDHDFIGNPTELCCIWSKRDKIHLRHRWGWNTVSSSYRPYDLLA